MEEMTNSDLERSLRRAVDRAVPDLYRQVADAVLTPLSPGALPVPAETRFAPGVRRLAGLCACFAILFSLGLFSFFKTNAVIGVEVNPSLTLNINCFGRVLEACPRNDDADHILAGLDLRYRNVDDALDAIMGAMVDHGYFAAEEVSVQVTISGGNQSRNEKLRERVTRDISRTVEKRGGHAVFALPKPAADPAPPPAPSPAPQPPVLTPAPALPPAGADPVPPPHTPLPPHENAEDDDDDEDDEDEEDDEAEDAKDQPGHVPKPPGSKPPNKVPPPPKGESSDDDTDTSSDEHKDGAQDEAQKDAQDDAQDAQKDAQDDAQDEARTEDDPLPPKEEGDSADQNDPPESQEEDLSPEEEPDPPDTEDPPEPLTPPESSPGNSSDLISGS